MKQNFTKISSIKYLLALILMLGASSLHAATYYWVGASGGSWTTTGNWSSTTDGVFTSVVSTPTTGDIVYFDGIRSTGTVGSPASTTYTDVSVALTAGTTIATLNISSGGTITFTANFSLTMTSALNFSNNTKLSATPTANGNGFILGSGGSFNVSGMSSTSYLDGNGNTYFTLNTTSTSTQTFFFGNTAAYGAIVPTRGIITLGSDVNTTRLTFGTNAGNVTQGVVVNGKTLTLSGGNSNTFNQQSNCAAIDASATGSRVIITASAQSILNQGGYIFKPSTTIDYLEFNSTGNVWNLYNPLTVNTLKLTAGSINNSLNNITINTAINKGGANNGNLVAAPIFGGTVAVTASASSTSGNELLGTGTGTKVGTLTVNDGFTYTLSGNGVTGYSFTNVGLGYATAPSVTFNTPTNGTAATGTAVVQGGVVVGINITNPGVGYTSTPTVTIGNAPGSFNSWVVSTAYTVNTIVTNGGNLYICTTAGTSAGSGSGPTTVGQNIVDNTVRWTYLSGPWGTSRSYVVGMTAIANGGLYLCTTANGSSASTGTGPSATSGTYITDGTVAWRYLGACAGLAPVNATATATYNSNNSLTVDNLVIGTGTSGVVNYPNNPNALTLNVSNNVTVNTGATLAPVTQSNTVTHLLNIGGNLTNSGTFTTSVTNGKLDVNMNGTGSQSINSPITFNGLTISNTAQPVLAGAALNTTTLTINNNAILNMQTNALSSVTTTSGTGKLRTQATASAVPASKTWTFNVEYNNGTGGQAVIGGIYTGGLTNSNTSGVNTISTAVTIGNVLTLNANSNLLLSGGITITAGTAFTGSTGSGTLQINDNNSTAYRIPRDLLWGGTVQFNFAGNSRIVPGTYNNLQVDDGTARTVNWGLANEAGTYTISGSLITSSTSYVVNLATVAFSGTNQTIPAISVYNLSLTGTGTTFPSGTVNIANTFNPGSITTANQGTISFNGSGAQTIPSFNYSRLLTSTGGTKTAAGNIDIATSLQVNSGTTLDMATYDLTNTAGSLANSGLGTLKTSSTSGTPLPSGRSWASYTVEYAATSGGQTIVSGTYNNLTLSNSSGTNSIGSTGGTVTVSNTLTTTSGGTFTVGANTLALNGPAVSGAGTISTTSSSSLSFGGTNAGPFSIPSNITALNNLTLNNTNATPATLTAGVGISLAGNLALTSGTFNDGGNTITLAGSITGTGTHTGSGKITMTGSSRNISGATLQNLTITSAGTVTLSGSPTIKGAFTVTTGTLATSTNTLTLDATTGSGVFGPASRLSIATSGTVNFNSRPVTLQSDATGTASITTISGTLSGASNVTVERYIPSNTRRSYVLVGSPASGASIYNAWQEGGASNAGYGTLITGGAAGGTLGFDLPTTSGKSIFTYNDNNASGSKWVGLANTNATNLSAGAGYLLFVRGDRTLNLATTPTASGNTTLRATGTIGQGSISPTLLSGANKYTLIANPYPCAIDWNSGSITKTNLTGNFTVYDANNNVFVSSNGTVKTPNVGNQQAGYIQSGQAFFVQNDGTGNGAITFTEGAKTTSATTSSSTTVFGEAANNAQLNINVYHTADNSFVDGAVALFSSKYKAAVDANEDIYKFTNLNETFGLRRNNVVLGLEARPAVSSKDSLYFSLSNFAKKAYSLVIDGSNLASTTAKLEDKYTGTTTEIDVRGTTTYNFTVTDDAASSSNDRFVITFGSTTASSAVIDGTAASSLYVKMSPNPVINQLQVSFKTATVEATSINVVNSLGQVVKTVNAGNVANGNVIVPVSELANGVYSVQLLSGNKVIHTQRVVKTAN